MLHKIVNLGVLVACLALRAYFSRFHTPRCDQKAMDARREPRQWSFHWRGEQQRRRAFWPQPGGPEPFGAHCVVARHLFGM